MSAPRRHHDGPEHGPVRAKRSARAQEQLRDRCRALLESGAVDVVVGYGAGDGDDRHPVFVTAPDAVDQLVFDDRCYHNLATYLTRPEIRRMGRPAVVVKGCDERAVVLLVQEAQLTRTRVHVIGMACAGVGEPVLAKCRTCDVHLPRNSDEVIGEAGDPAVDISVRYADVAEFLTLTAAERFEYWTAEFARCTRCYACRQVCPMCYCTVCVLDRNRPQSVATSPHPAGTLAFHLTRAFHLAGRCVGCDECARACPAGIDLPLLNRSLARATEQEFGFRPGLDPAVDLVIGRYSAHDTEDFIR